MRKRIYRISEDKFDNQKPHIEFESESFELNFYVGDEAKGTLNFKSTNGVEARGIVYCSSPYIKLSTTQFDSCDVSIDFVLDEIFCKANEVIKGYFTVVTVGIEKDIPFSITFKKKPLVTANGELNTLEEFLEFAQKRYYEAQTVFYSENFATFMSDKPKEQRLIYRAYRNAAKTSANFDEFFVALGLKERMTFDMKEKTDEYLDVNENLRGEIELTRNTWGYIDIAVSCDADFITLEKDRITSDHFLGSVFTMSYFVNYRKLHNGLNYARISFDFRGIHKEITVVATKDKNFVFSLSSSQADNRRFLELYRHYEEFRLRRITCGQWCKDSINMIDGLRGKDEEKDNWLLLYKAQCFITNKQKQEALWIIQDLKRSIDDKRSSAWAYLLYLCTLIEREESYVDRLTADIESIYRDHPRDVRIFWFLLFLRKEYIKNPTAKLRAIAEWINAGYETPILYIEAYYVFVQDPYLISSLDSFTLKVLLWANKHNAITKDMAVQMVHVLEVEKNFNPKAMELFKVCYTIYPELNLLMGIVTHLIKNGVSDSKYFGWYEKAIECNISVSGLYEAYLNTMPLLSTDRLPQVVTLFFQYNNSLSVEKRALLYANVILHKDEDEETYRQYERTIERFSIEQLKAGRFDDNLAVCYGQLLKIGIIDGDLAWQFYRLFYTKKIGLFDDTIRRIFFYQEEYVAPEIVPVTGKTAYVTSKPGKGLVFMEDARGNLLYEKGGYMESEVVASEGYMSQVRDAIPSAWFFLLEDLMSGLTAIELDLKYMDAMEQLLTSEDLSESYRQTLYPVIIEYFTIHSREELLEKYFMKNADLKALPAEVISSLMDVFAVRNKYEEAFYLVQHVNAAKIKTDTAKKICQFMINKKQDAIDDFLILFAAQLVEKDSIRGDMISYLVMNYVGPTRIMMGIFERALDMSLDVVEFAERILIQALYEDIMPDKIMDVFEVYVGRKNNRMVVEAFLTYQAHAYLSLGAEVSENVFAYIFHRYKKGLNLNESMRVALIKYLCTCNSNEEEDIEVLDELLNTAISRNQYFSFYNQCDRRLLVKYHLYDKFFVEYKGVQKDRIKIIYSINEAETVEEDMIEMYDGLFVKQFVLFFGDQLQYEIYKDEINGEPLESAQIVNSDSMSDSIGGRFGLMNSINRSRLYSQTDDLMSAMKQYQGLDVVTRDLFNTI